MRTASIATVVLIVTLVSSAAGQMPEPADPSSSSSQNQGQLPAPQPQQPPPWHPDPSESYLGREGILCGGGVTNSPIAAKPTVGCGVGATIPPLPFFIEIGMMGPQANRSAYTGYISFDGSIPLARMSSKYLPMAMFGYTRLFETGHALDYGLALAMPRFGKPKDDGSSLRLELRDYWTFANPAQHNIMLRIGWMGTVPD